MGELPPKELTPKMIQELINALDKKSIVSTKTTTPPSLSDQNTSPSRQILDFHLGWLPKQKPKRK